MKLLKVLFYLAVLGVAVFSLGYLIHGALHGSAVALPLLICVLIGGTK